MKRRSKIFINQKPAELEVKYKEQNLHAAVLKEQQWVLAHVLGMKTIELLSHKTKAGATVKLNRENPN